MDYKKAYKEALERAKYLKENTDSVGAKDISYNFEYIFPELRESEDEKIRKGIIKSITDLNTDWLELHGVTKENALAWLEKQGEQKPNDKIQIGKKYKCIASPRYSTFMIGRVYKPEDKFLCSLMNFCSDCFEPIEDEQKSNDKIEPKFKVGDWVVYNRNDSSREILYVYDIRDSRYYFNDNIHLSWSVKECDKKCHLWTIQDAKDGDVLAFDSDTIVIFKDLYNATTFHSYCHIEDGVFTASEEGVPDWWEGKGFYPATKEQHDILFQKMKEAGYEWDAEKKELRKFNNALEECEIEHIEHGKYYYCIKDYYSGGCKRASKGEVVQALRGMSMMALGVKANEYFIPVKCIVDGRPAWSEEDEEMFDAIVADIQFTQKAHNHEVNQIVYEREIDWLKSIKPNHWKPSQEQMKAIKYFIDFHRPQANASIEGWKEFKHLESLYNNLKNL